MPSEATTGEPTSSNPDRRSPNRPLQNKDGNIPSAAELRPFPAFEPAQKPHIGKRKSNIEQHDEKNKKKSLQSQQERESSSSAQLPHYAVLGITSGDGKDALHDASDEEDEDDNIGAEGDDLVLEEDREINLAVIKSLADWDETLDVGQRRKMQSELAAWDQYSEEWLRKRLGDKVSKASMNLALRVYPRTIEGIAMESRGVFAVKHGKLSQRIKLRLSLRPFLLDKSFVLDGVPHQLLVGVIAVLIEEGGKHVRHMFQQYADGGKKNRLSFATVKANGHAARHAGNVTGIYVRFHGNTDSYIGISDKIQTRNRVHDRLEGVNRRQRALGIRQRDYSAKVVAEFGSKSICDLPRPLLLAMESVLIGAGRLTTSQNSIQMNVADHLGFRKHNDTASHVSQKKHEHRGRVEAQLCAVWKRLYEMEQEALCQWHKGRYGTGTPFLPAFHSTSAKLSGPFLDFLMPFAKACGLSDYKFQMALFSRKPALDGNDKLIMVPIYPALAEVVAAMPIREGSFHIPDSGHSMAKRVSFPFTSFGSQANDVPRQDLMPKRKPEGGWQGSMPSDVEREELLAECRSMLYNLRKGTNDCTIHAQPLY